MLLKRLKRSFWCNFCTDLLTIITAGEAGPLHLETTLTRAKFNELTHDLIERTKIPVRNALQDAGLTNADIDEVILVGGSTRILQLKKLLKLKLVILQMNLLTLMKLLL